MISDINNMGRGFDLKKVQRNLFVAMLCCGMAAQVGVCRASAGDAAEKTVDVKLDEVVVTANRTPVKTAETAASITVITADQIEKGGYTRVTEILEQTNLWVADVGNGAAGVNSVAINGDDRVLILVDGRKINREYFIGMGKTRVNLNQLPSVKNIERIEIVRGPASALYGSDAAGGVINIITRKGEMTGTDLTFQAGSSGQQIYTLATEGKSRDFSYRVTAERKSQNDYDYKDYKTGTVKTMPNSYVRQNAATVRLDRNLGDNRSLTFYYERLDGRSGYALMPPGFAQHHATAYEISQEDNVDITYRWGKKAGENHLKVYHNSARYDIFGANDANQPDKFLTSRTTGAEWQQKWQIGKSYSLLGGLEWRQVKVDAPTDGISNKLLNNQAVFLENRWTLPANWTLTAGLRYDEHNVFGGKPTARISFNRQVNDHTNYYFSWGQIFKAPNAEELYGQSQAIGNPNLKPEVGDSFTIGLNAKLAKGLKLQTSLFYSRIRDAIYFYPIDSSYMYWKFENLQEQKRQGIDISLIKKLSRDWQVVLGYAYTDIKNKNKTDASFHADPDNGQPHAYRLTVQYDHDKWRGELGLRGASGRSLASFSSRSYWVMDLSLGYQINDNMRAFLKAYNLTDQAYEVRGGAGAVGAFPIAARRFYLGIEQHF